MSWTDWLAAGVIGFNRGVIYYFLALNTIYLLLFLLSLRRVLRFVHRTFFSDYAQARDSPLTWPISIIVAAHNEEKTITETARSLLRVSYREFEVVIVNDGSTDATLARLTEAFALKRVDRIYRESIPTEAVAGTYDSRLHPNLTVIDKRRGGKADALNAGINLSRYPLFASIDGDSLIEDNALVRLVRPFLERPQETLAAGGIVRIANGCRVRDGSVEGVALPDRALPILQAVEYLRAFLTGRVGWSAIGSLLIISGAFGIYKKQAVIEVGGYGKDTDTEDLELVVRLHREMRRAGRPYRVVFVPDPVCWTEAPDRLLGLMRQRTRWHRGLVQTLWRNRGMLFNPRYGIVGTVAFPYFVLFEMLGPFIEILGYVTVVLAWLLGLLDPGMLLLFVTVAILYGVFLSVAAVLLEELSFRRYPQWGDLLKLIAFGVLENFGYRQLLSLFKLKGFWDLARGRRAWGAMDRAGFRSRGAAGRAAGR